MDQINLNNTKIGQLERQVERSQLFTHTALGKGFAQIGEISTFVYGLIDVLLTKGLITEDELQAAAANVHQAMAGQGEFMGPGTFIRLEEKPDAVNRTIEVDCQARMHICHAVCCKLNFALTISEIESTAIKWDLGQPYQIRHNEDGYCSHLQQNPGMCQIYNNRPGVCRHYSCAEDDRIWKDFDKMELNIEWISANLPPGSPERLLGTLMDIQGEHPEPKNF